MNHKIKKADRKYQEEVAKIESTAWAEMDKKIENTYLGLYANEMRSGILLFSCWLVDAYISILVKNRLFDETALSHVDMKKSNSILGTIADAVDKKSVIVDSLLRCPFNLDVYLKAQDFGLLSEDILCIAKVFGLYNTVFKCLRKQLREHYLWLRDIAHDVNKCTDFLKKHYSDILSIDISSIKELISPIVTNGVSVELVALLFDRLGKMDFQVEVSIFDTRSPSQLKDSIDAYYTQAICKNCENCLAIFREKTILEKQIAELNERITAKEQEIHNLGIALFGVKAKRKKELQQQVAELKEDCYQLSLKIKKQ